MKYPKTVKVDGAKYKICTDFRTIFNLHQTMPKLIIQDNENDPWRCYDALVYFLEGMYFGNVPQNVEVAGVTAFQFTRCYDEIENSPVPSEDDNRKYILPALEMDGIIFDKSRYAKLHWWAFMKDFGGIRCSAHSKVRRLFVKWNSGNLSDDERHECERYGWNKTAILDMWR